MQVIPEISNRPEDVIRSLGENQILVKVVFDKVELKKKLQMLIERERNWFEKLCKENNLTIEKAKEFVINYGTPEAGKQW